MNYEEYKSCLKNIEEYELNMKSQLVGSYVCISCQEKEISPLKFSKIDPLGQEHMSWDNGVVFLVSCGYGSRYDLDSFYMGICDNCIEKLDRIGILKNYREIANSQKELLSK